MPSLFEGFEHLATCMLILLSLGLSLVVCCFILLLGQYEKKYTILNHARTLWLHLHDADLYYVTVDLVNL